MQSAIDRELVTVSFLSGTAQACNEQLKLLQKHKTMAHNQQNLNSFMVLNSKIFFSFASNMITGGEKLSMFWQWNRIY